MKKSKLIVLIMVVFSLSLGGCSFFNGQSAKKQEMIQIAESKKAKDVIENLSKEGAVDKALISIGYSKWGKGQLERELAENVWLTVPADEHILFDVPYELRYAAAFEKLGVNPNALISGVGHA